MTYTAYDSSRKSAKPINLFLFRSGSGTDDIFTYTNSELDNIVMDDGSGIGPQTYSKIAIKYDRISLQGSLDKTNLTVSLPDESDLSTRFRGVPPSAGTSLVIFEGFIGDPDSEFVASWVGRVISSKMVTPELQLTCEPASTSMRRTGLRWRWQYGCQHVLYDSETCRADKTAASVTATIAAIDGNNVTLDAGWQGSFAADKFLNGGRFEWDPATGSHEIRSIRSISGDIVTLSFPTRDLSVGDSVTLALGCTHQYDDCANLHVESGSGGLPNAKNYGGCRWIPLKNPIGIRSW